MDNISIDFLKKHVQSLQFDRSPVGHVKELDQAGLYIHDELVAAGLRVWKEPFRWEGQGFQNIVGEKKGEFYPERILILGAHYDTVPGSPGADDNASAVAVLLELARSLQSVRLGMTVRLIAFSLEESGYVGSTHHAEKAMREGEQIVGMISLEMVGFTAPRQNYPSYINPKFFPPVGDFIGIVANHRSEGLLDEVRRCLRKHIPQLQAEFLLVPKNGEGMEEMRLSDHSPFWDRGVPALMVTDTAFLRNPNYHLPTDTVETLDFEFMKKVAVGMHHAVLELAR